MPAKPGGPEDLLAEELACALSGLPLPHDEWKKKVRSIPPGRKGKSSNRKGTSVNWWWRAMAVAAIHGDRVVDEMLELYFSESNDLDCSECYVALGMYFVDNLTGKTALRDALRFGNRRNETLARKLDAEIRQVHASLLILSSDLDHLAVNWVQMAGPRGGSASEGDGKAHRGTFEYLVLRSAGWTDKQIEVGVKDGRPMVKGISGNNPLRGMTWIRHHVEQLEKSLQADAAPCWQAYREHGKRGLVQFIKTGTRVPFRWIVAEGGIAAVMERNPNSFKGPKVVSLKERGKDPIGFPFGARKIGFVASTAEVNDETGRIVAEVEGCGKFNHATPWGKREIDLRLGPSGVVDLLAGEIPPEDEEEPPTPDDPPVEEEPGNHENPTPDAEVSWWKRLVQGWKEWWSGR